MRTVVVIQCALHLRKSVADEDCVGSKEKSRLWEHGCVDVDGSVHFGEVFQSFSKEKFRIAKRGVLWCVSPSVDGRDEGENAEPCSLFGIGKRLGKLHPEHLLRKQSFAEHAEVAWPADVA